MAQVVSKKLQLGIEVDAKSSSKHLASTVRYAAAMSSFDVVRDEPVRVKTSRPRAQKQALIRRDGRT
jgi:hypothetical protein